MLYRLPIAVAALLTSCCLLAASGAEDAKILAIIDARLAQEPSNPRLWTARGIALERLGRGSESLQSFEKALNISPKFLEALEGAAEVAYARKDPRTSGYLRRILDQDPNNATAHAMAGALAFEARDCHASVEHFQLSGAVAKKDPTALAQWGECLLNLDRAAMAVPVLRGSLGLTESDPRVRFDLAVALHLSGHQEDALAVAQPLPEQAAVMNLRASIFTAQDRFPDALAAYRRAIELAPKDERNYIDLASLCLDHQSFDVASDVVNAGLSVNPKSGALYTMRGAIAAQFSKMEDAAADFERARHLQPDQTYSDAGLSLLLEQQDQIDQAIALLRPRLAKTPEDASLHFLLADLLLRSQGNEANKRTEAKSHLLRAIQLQPELGKAHAELGKLELQEGDAPAAVAELQTALRYDGDDRVARNQLVLALRKLGRTEDARAAADQLRELLAASRKDEVKKNSVRFVRLAPGRP